jgi:hypothetical protein
MSEAGPLARLYMVAPRNFEPEPFAALARSTPVIQYP